MTFKEANGNKDNIKIALTEKWKELFEIEDEIKSDVSFFDIGGNSLIAGILFSDIEEQLGVKMNVSDIYDHDTIETLSDYIMNL